MSATDKIECPRYARENIYDTAFNARETLNKSTFCGEPAQLCDAGSSKINGL